MDEARDAIAGIIAKYHIGCNLPIDCYSECDKCCAQALIDAGYRKVPELKVICLCGSTRFTHEMLVRQWELTKQGFVVLSWCALPDDYYKDWDKTHIGDREGVKSIVDEVHLRKIDLSDRIEVIRAGKATGWEIGTPYDRPFITHLGESTLSEMSYAKKQGKPVTFYPPDDALLKNWNNKAQLKSIKKQIEETRTSL